MYTPKGLRTLKFLAIIATLQTLVTSLVFWPSVSIAENYIKLRTDLESELSQSLDSTNIRHLKTVQCILKHINWEYEIRSSPVKRNRILTRKNEIDGFFLHSPRLMPDTIAKTSQPIAIERWFMFQRKSGDNSNNTGDPSVSAVLGSNEHHWLEQHNYKKIITAPNLSSVVKMLHRERVTYALADQKRFWRNVFLTETPAGKFSAYFVRYAPLVMYFSNEFIEKNPDFLNHFNSNIDSCTQDRLKPTKEEAQHLLNIQEGILRKDGNQINLATIIKAQLEDRTSVANQKEEDKRWTVAKEQETRTKLMDQIEDNALSDFLRRLTRLGNSKISEIFVMDTDGYILGMNRATSDYWQGDEAPYKSIMENRQRQHISEIDFDASTQKFQIQITIPIKDPETQRIIALMTTGFDADIALTSAFDF